MDIFVSASTYICVSKVIAKFCLWTHELFSEPFLLTFCEQSDC